jgi:hypothetical protein
MADRLSIPLTLEAKWRAYHAAMRNWQNLMTGMPPTEEMDPYMAWRPPPAPPMRGRPDLFDASLAATPGIATPATARSPRSPGTSAHPSPVS